MSVLELRVDRKPGSPGLDTDAVIRELRRNFPEVVVCPEDKMASQVRRGEHLQVDSPDKSPEQVLQTLKRNAARSGPQYSFDLPLGAGNLVKGYVQRFVIVFLYDEPLRDEAENRLLEFLRTFRMGVIKRTSSNGQVEELL